MKSRLRNWTAWVRTGICPRELSFRSLPTKSNANRARQKTRPPGELIVGMRFLCCAWVEFFYTHTCNFPSPHPPCETRSPPTFLATHPPPQNILQGLYAFGLWLDFKWLWTPSVPLKLQFSSVALLPGYWNLYCDSCKHYGLQKSHHSPSTWRPRCTCNSTFIHFLLMKSETSAYPLCQFCIKGCLKWYVYRSECVIFFYAAHCVTLSTGIMYSRTCSNGHVHTPDSQKMLMVA